jgi:branched-chain amino acid transport system substrate-binding protein
VIKQAREIMPDAALMVADGCLSSDTLKNAGPDAEGVFASSPDPSGTAGPFYTEELIPAYREAFNTAPLAVFHGHAFDATNILLDAIEAVAIENDDGSLSIPRQALRDEVFATEGYQGVVGTFTCTELGDCATDVTIGVFEAPAWPVEGGAEGEAVYSDTKSLDDVL